MEVTNLQLFAIAVIGIAVVVYLIWRSESVQRAEDDAEILALDTKQHTQQDEGRRAHLEKMDAYNEACNGMEPFCGEGKKP